MAFVSSMVVSFDCLHERGGFVSLVVFDTGPESTILPPAASFVYARCMRDLPLPGGNYSVMAAEKANASKAREPEELRSLRMQALEACNNSMIASSYNTLRQQAIRYVAGSFLNHANSPTGVR